MSMHRRLALPLLTFAAVSALAGPAAAASVNFDTLPNGGAIPPGDSTATETPITTQYASIGVTFTGLFDTGATGAPAATRYSAGPEGPNYQRNYLGNAQTGEPFVIGPPFSLTPRFEIVRLAFDGGADAISLSLNNFSLIGTTTFNAYGATGNLLESFTTNQGTGWDRRALASSDVFRLDLVSNVFNGSRLFFGIDNLEFTLNAVNPGIPEPASWAMMIAGFGLAGTAMRRRSARTAAFA